MPLSKNVIALSKLPWFPQVMKELGYEPVRHGQWERHFSRPNVYADMFWHCSECGYKNENQWANKYHNYCPCCGAKMDESTIGQQNVVDESTIGQQNEVEE